MKILADYHTHTIYSHGKGTIEDNVKVAISKGIETLGIIAMIIAILLAAP